MSRLMMVTFVCAWLLPETAKACLGGGSSSSVTCPSIVTEKSFDLTRFTGQWYGIYTTDEDESKNVKCSNVFFSTISEGLQAYFANSTKNTETTEGRIYKQDSSLVHNFEVTTIGECSRQPSSIPMQTIGTDYQSYALLYSCTVKDNILIEKALLLSRNTALSDDVKNQATAGTKVQLYPLVQTGCSC